MVHISPAIFDDLTGKIQFSPTEFEPLLDSEQGDDLEQLWDHPDTAQRDKKRSAGGQGRTSRATVRVGAPRTGLRPCGEKPWWAWQVPNTHDRLARGQRLPERPEKAHSLGRPPERREVGKRRASRHLALGLTVVSSVWKIWRVLGKVFHAGSHVS